MERNNNSDKTKFKVKFLGEYHDMVIDWNDNKYEYKQQQVFDQLASLTGIPRKYKTLFMLLEARPHLHKDYPNDEIWVQNNDRGHRRHLNFYNADVYRQPDIRFGCKFVKDNIHDVCILDGERFQLRFHVHYNDSDLKRIIIYYDFIAETEAQEGVCVLYLCQHTQTKSYLNRIKDLVTNEELNSQISHRIQPVKENMQATGLINNGLAEMEQIYREFNIQQYLTYNCHLNPPQHRFVGREGYIMLEIHQYLRMRG